MEKVLVIQTAFIGDAILGTTLLEQIHYDYPSAHIDYLIRKGNESLFEQHPFLNRLLVWDKKGAKYKDLFRLLKTIRKQEYDAVLNIQRFAASGFLTAFSGANEKVGYSNNPFSLLFSKSVKHRFGAGFENVHEIERILNLWEKEKRDFGPKLYPSEASFLVIDKYQTKPYVTIAPASVWFTKQFPSRKWIELINQIPKNLQVFLVGGQSDQKLSERICSVANREVINLTGKLKLLQTAALMKGAKMNYANDSAPVHLASAVDAPICEVFCSTVPEFGFTPLSSNSHVIQVKEKLDCRPCGMHGRSACPKGHFSCANNIELSAMLDVLG